ncbi:MAG: flagellar assembly protein FliW [Clostridiales bacterium]|jgi:flagellar assembly factor FliW|nr:flagellar assembly protein FliW [Clostridiales bacterium]
MKLKTKHFGEIEYDPSLAIDFDEGLPGFPENKKFIVLLENQEEDTFCWLQSIDDGDLAFALINIYNVIPEYNPLVRSEEVAALGDFSENNLLVYNVVVIPDDIKQMRANLRAPIVINPDTKKGKQVILDNEEYEMKYKIFDEVERSKSAAVGAY